MDEKQFVVEIVKHIAWPLVTILAVFFIKDKLDSLFSGGVKSAKLGDAEVQFFESRQNSQVNAEFKQDLQHLIPIDPTGIREELEGKIRTQLESVNDEKEKLNILIKNLAQQQISGYFDKIYYSIFGSQIKLLEFLLVKPKGEANLQEVIPFFENTKKSYPEAFSGKFFSDYIEFLISWELVGNVGDEYSITANGKAFIAYITAMKFNKNKAL